jgi:hypothetical protein
MPLMSRCLVLLAALLLVALWYLIAPRFWRWLRR